MVVGVVAAVVAEGLIYVDVGDVGDRKQEAGVRRQGAGRQEGRG